MKMGILKKDGSLKICICKCQCFFFFVNLVIGFICFLSKFLDVPPNSLMDSTMNPKMKIVKGKGVEAHSLAHNTLGVKGRGRALGWD